MNSSWMLQEAQNWLAEKLQFTVNLSSLKSKMVSIFLILMEIYFVFELELPNLIAQNISNERNALIMKAQLQNTDPLSKKNFKKSATLILTFFNEDEYIYQNEEDIEVFEQYNRVTVAQIIDNARESCENYRFCTALLYFYFTNTITNQLTNGFIGSFPYLRLYQAKQASQRGIFTSYGQGQMMQLSCNSYKQQGVNQIFPLDGILQQQSAKFQTFSNQLQQDMVQQLQFRKTQN
ncbi:unnamed protein product [Paramecium octaurelia]|uniref:Uncharacterized protein n=1 Tax=Paramecium octaurelia TaxID=43137 RepID=A0A8S1X9F2_PAROT|nr:unnamed protein product [Paramecium octaurelia]